MRNFHFLDAANSSGFAASSGSFDMTNPALNIATLNIAVKAARRASQIINRAARNLDLLDVASKQPNDFVTQVDCAAEAAIIEILQEGTPDFGILAEESGLSTGRNPQGEYQWVIDPLDGTTNFIHGFPQYAVSIALMRQDQVEQGVVYDVNRNELFVAAKGKGAFLNDRRLRVSGRRRLQEALIGTGFPYRDFQHLDSYLRIFRELTQKTAGLRRPGAAALDLAYVAAGRLDGFWEFGLAPWDMAAGSLMITEAGGYACDPFSDADYLHSGNIIAASPRILTQLQSVIQNAMKATPPTP
jgi:myo-inositol-1(or 4)-monophosphatase